MGSVLVVGGWVELQSDEAISAWRKKKLAMAKLSGWGGPIAAPEAGSAFDRWSIDELWQNAREAPEAIEIVESGRGVRFAAALSSVTGRALWAPALLAAVRRAAGLGQGAAWASYVSETPGVLAASASGRGSFRELDDDEESARVFDEPELARALDLIDGHPPSEGALSLLPARAVEPCGKKAPAKLAASKRGSRTRPVTAPAVPAKPAPRVRKLALRLKTSITGIARLSSGEIVMTSMFGQLANGHTDANEWTLAATSIGKLWWLAAHDERLWVGAATGLHVSDDGGTSFAPRGPSDTLWSSVLPVGDAILGCTNGEIQRSTDDGRTWTSVFRVADHFGVGELIRGAGDDIIGTGLAGRVFLSRDRGQSFECVQHGPSEAFGGVAREGDDLWYIGPSRLMHAKSTDPGNYQPAGPKKPRQMNYARVRAAHGTVWIAAEGQLLRSLDRGASWQITLERNTVFNDVLPPRPSPSHHRHIRRHGVRDRGLSALTPTACVVSVLMAEGASSEATHGEPSGRCALRRSSLDSISCSARRSRRSHPETVRAHAEQTGVCRDAPGGEHGKRVQLELASAPGLGAPWPRLLDEITDSVRVTP